MEILSNLLAEELNSLKSDIISQTQKLSNNNTFPHNQNAYEVTINGTSGELSYISKQEKKELTELQSNFKKWIHEKKSQLKAMLTYND